MTFGEINQRLSENQRAILQPFFDECITLRKKYRYGYIKDNVPVLKHDEYLIDFEHEYKTIEPSLFEKHIVGICYDIAHYLYYRALQLFHDHKEIVPSLWYSDAVDKKGKWWHHAFTTLQLDDGSIFWYEYTMFALKGPYLFISEPKFLSEYKDMWINGSTDLESNLFRYTYPQSFNMTQDELIKWIESVGKQEQYTLKL